MLQNALILIISFLFSSILEAQQLIPLDEEEYLNSIKFEIKKNAKTRLESYLLLSEFWAQKDSLKSHQALKKVEIDPEKKTLPNGMLDYYQAVYYANKGDKSQAINHYNTAIKLLQNDAVNTALLIKALYNVAYIQVEDKGYDYMVKTLTEKCIPLSKKISNKELLAYSYTQLGLTFMSVGQFDKADEYHKEALKQFNDKENSSTSKLLTELNLVSNYCYKPDSKSAKRHLDNAKKILQKYPNSQHFANYYYQEAMYYTTIQDYDKSLASLNLGLKRAKDNNQSKLLNMLYFRMYNVHLMQKDYPKAKAQLEKILKDNVISREAINRKITYTQLAAVNDVLGNHKEAYTWMKKSSTLSDSLQQQKLLEKMQELEILHQTADKKQIISKLEQEKKENELIAKNKNLRISILAIALLLSLIIAFLIYLTYKNQKKLNNQINISHQQELYTIENERKYEATKAVLQGEEQERQRIAQDLHDSIGGMLANIRMSITSLDKEKIAILSGKIDKTISEMRRISRNLMPETLKNLGLEIALKELCETMTHKKLFIQFESYNLSKNIPFNTQLALYRITQESISNVIKYAQASSIIVQISQDSNKLNLTIEDDGIGFNTSEITYGLGLKNIENRAKLINATIDLISNKGEGTTINVECYV